MSNASSEWTPNELGAIEEAATVGLRGVAAADFLQSRLAGRTGKAIYTKMARIKDSAMPRFQERMADLMASVYGIYMPSKAKKVESQLPLAVPGVPQPLSVSDEILHEAIKVLEDIRQEIRLLRDESWRCRDEQLKGMSQLKGMLGRYLKESKKEEESSSSVPKSGVNGTVADSSQQ